MSSPKYKKVSSAKALTNAINALAKEGPAALDFETTALHPDHGEVRLVTLANKKRRYLVDFWKIRGRFKSQAKKFRKGTWIVFNSKFENRWFAAAGADGVTTWDLAYMRKAVLGGGGYSLKQLMLWDLDREMDKEEQASDWGAKVLTKKQLDYAMLDSIGTWDLAVHWMQQMDAEHWECFHMFNDMAPAVIEMEDAGMMLDADRHEQLTYHWEDIQADKVRALREMVDEDEVANFDSNTQWADYFSQNIPDDDFLAAWPKTEKTGQLSITTEVLRDLAGIIARDQGANMMTVFFDTLADYKKISKYISSFGHSLVTSARLNPDGRVHANFNIGAAKTGRFSCSGPNLQQVPRDLELLGEETSVRRSFIAPRGKVLVSLDYSGIELRMLALLSGDKQLLEDVIYGDVHAEVASVIAGKKINKKTKAGKRARQAAKGVSFGIIYGSGANRLATTMYTSIGNAQLYIDFWSDRYPDAFDYRNKMMDEARKTRFIRVADGGTIYMSKTPALPKCANYPVQRAALSCMAKAIARHKFSLDEARKSGKQQATLMLSTIHDALIDEARKRNAKPLLRMMDKDMTQGYLDIFPGAPIDKLVEGGIGPSWGELEE